MKNLKYLIDHVTKTIHQRDYAGDRYGFLNTPIDKREFIGDGAYIELLKTEKGYKVCNSCQTFQLLTR
ncbi:hypothetical protein QWY16_11055 [Planococcus shenhongbingii]|uniref:hypothetical protein n=1 Tax=Planococcus shenhongbingii TaxID=3058398 RepID=UPI0026059C3E|nr:hypothetical protein [Planococcus sp. N016]WKA57046.1 hypothetical protein QWY16_11055 [Planococcus sp. N016]